MNHYKELDCVMDEVYPSPPWHYRGCRVLNVICEAQDPTELHRLIPTPLEPIGVGGTFIVWFAHASRIDEADENYRSAEGGIVIPTRSPDGSVIGGAFSTIYVDNDIALSAGREIWGYPKQLGSVRFEVDGHDRVRVAAFRSEYRDDPGACVISAEARLDGTCGEVLETLTGLRRRFLKRVVANPFASGAQSEDVVCVTTELLNMHESRTGRAVVELSPRFGIGSFRVIGAAYQVCDFRLPFAQPIDQVIPDETA